MADSKKYNGSTWEHSLRKLTTATDTLTALPADVYADGNNATVGLKGNTVQSGTPTSDSPIMPQGTGERTGNLFDDDNAEFGKWVNSNGTNATYAAGYDIKVGTVSEFAIKYYGNKPYSYSMAFYDSNGDFLTRVHRSNPSASYDTFSVPENAVSARFQVATQTDIVMTSAILKAMKLMLNTGSTALPYEPYGYKIPISSGGATTNIYLGSTHTVRQVKKLVLTGQEDWILASINSHGIANFRYPGTIDDRLGGTGNVLSSHLPMSASGNADATNESVRITTTNILYLRRFESEISTVSALQQWLAQQYANGTPICVWYVLETATTGIVNEPLMKIGDYADTVSGITIPTITGNDTFDVETTLKPSEASISYTGWHDAEVKEKSENLILFADLQSASSGTIYTKDSQGYSCPHLYIITLKPNTYYTMSTNYVKTANNNNIVYFEYADVENAINSENPVTIQTSETGILHIGYYSTRTGANLFETGVAYVMLNEGSTALPYEPYWK